MPNYMDEVFKKVYERYHDEVLSETWGHLHPEAERHYEGWMLFTFSAYGELVLIDNDWEGLSDSPWLNDDMREYWGQLVHEQALKRGHIYRFDGLYVRHLTPGVESEDDDIESTEDEWNWEFTGSYSEIKTK